MTIIAPIIFYLGSTFVQFIQKVIEGQQLFPFLREDEWWSGRWVHVRSKRENWLRYCTPYFFTTTNFESVEKDSFLTDKVSAKDMSQTNKHWNFARGKSKYVTKQLMIHHCSLSKDLCLCTYVALVAHILVTKGSNQKQNLTTTSLSDLTLTTTIVKFLHNRFAYFSRFSFRDFSFRDFFFRDYSTIPLRVFTRFSIRSDEVAFGRRWMPVCNWTNICWKRVSSLTMQRMNDQMLAWARSRRRFNLLWKPKRVHAESMSRNTVHTHLHMCYSFYDRNPEHSTFLKESYSSSIHRNTEITAAILVSPLYSVWRVIDRRKFRLQRAAAVATPSACDSSSWFLRLRRKM